MRLPIYVIDAFSDRPLAGNPAAVCPLEAWLPDATMQAIAAEMNLSETAFIVRAGEHWRIRWMTPTKEVGLIGHATLAAGALVLDRLEPGLSRVRFTGLGGELTVARGAGRQLTLDMPALVPKPVASPPVALAAALGRKPDTVLAAMHYLCVLPSSADIRALAPDMAGLAALDLPAVIVTAPGEGEFDFVSRFFAPANGVPEDSVSGVAHCCLTPYWSARLGKRQLLGRQLSARGGTVACEDRGAIARLGGATAMFLEGTIEV